MSQNQKTIAENRKARHEYELYDRFEAGLVLQGTEIKSIRRGKVQLKDSYISFQKGEAFIKGMHISPYEFGNRFNHDETRDRKLLMHKQEIQKLEQSARVKGYTVVPVSKGEGCAKRDSKGLEKSVLIDYTDVPWGCSGIR